MSLRILIPQARKAAQARPAGYIDALLAGGKVNGDILEIDQATWEAVQAKFADGKEHPLPSLATRGAHFAAALARATSRVLAGQPIRVPDAVEAARAEYCHGCDKFRKSDQRCGLCGCCIGQPILDKLKWSGESCPDNPPKWVTYNEPS